MKYLFIVLTALSLSINAQIITTIAGNDTSTHIGDGGQATLAELTQPYGITIDALGNLYIADTYDYLIRKVNNAGIIKTVAGNGIASFSGDGGQATNATFNQPFDVKLDAVGNLYIADYINNRIRKVNTLGIVSTIAGNGNYGFSGDGGQATAAELYHPRGVAFDAMGNLYIADYDNNRIRKVNTAGIISTVAGSSSSGFSGDGGQATAAELNNPWGIALDVAGNLYIADYINNRVRKVNTLGIISTIIGNGTQGYSGDGGQATAAELDFPDELAFDAVGNLYISDRNNYCIRKVTNVGQAGIEQVANINEQVIVYPNPANTSLTLSLSKGEGTSMFIMFDMMGNAVKQSIIYNLTSIINIADLAEGIYNISITNKAGCLNKKVIIVR